MRFWVCLIVLCWMIHSSFAQQKLDQLLVYGDGFIFSVKEPSGWKGDTANAEKFQCNVVLHEAGQPSESFAGLIRSRLNDKADENTSADLEEDMRDYKARHPNVHFKDLFTKHPSYQCLAKIFYIPGTSYEYVAYVNPGAHKPFLFSVSMNSGKSEANAEELDAFRSAVQSLRLHKP